MEETIISYDDVAKELSKIKGIKAKKVNYGDGITVVEATHYRRGIRFTVSESETGITADRFEIIKREINLRLNPH